MRKLALSDEILMQIEKPARYIGNELNSVVKDDTSQIRLDRKSTRLNSSHIL